MNSVRFRSKRLENSFSMIHPGKAVKSGVMCNAAKSIKLLRMMSEAKEVQNEQKGSEKKLIRELQKRKLAAWPMLTTFANVFLIAFCFSSDFKIRTLVVSYRPC